MSGGGFEAGWAVAFLAGLLSILSPCVAPLLPGYLSFLAGGAGLGRASSRGETERVLTVSLLFVLGFTSVFVAMGAGAALFGTLLDAFRPLFNRVAGLTMILMGIIVSGLIRIPLLMEQRGPHLIDQPTGPIGAVLVGMAFALGWTPCVGPILATILLYASSLETAEEGALMLLAYSVGFGVPLILIGLGWTRALGLFQWVARWSRILNLVSGSILIGLGLLFFTNQVFHLNLLAQRLYYALVRW